MLSPRWILLLLHLPPSTKKMKNKTLISVFITANCLSWEIWKHRLGAGNGIKDAVNTRQYSWIRKDFKTYDSRAKCAMGGKNRSSWWDECLRFLLWCVGWRGDQMKTSDVLSEDTYAWRSSPEVFTLISFEINISLIVCGYSDWLSKQWWKFRMHTVLFSDQEDESSALVFCHTHGDYKTLHAVRLCHHFNLQNICFPSIALECKSTWLKYA